MIEMRRILQPAAENLVYRHRLSHEDDLDDLVLRLERHLTQDKKQRLAALPDPDSLSSIPADAKARNVVPQTHDLNSPNIPTMAHGNYEYVGSVHTLERSDCSGSDTTECPQLGSPMVSECETV